MLRRHLRWGKWEGILHASLPIGQLHHAQGVAYVRFNRWIPPSPHMCRFPHVRRAHVFCASVWCFQAGEKKSPSLSPERASDGGNFILFLMMFYVRYTWVRSVDSLEDNWIKIQLKCRQQHHLNINSSSCSCNIIFHRLPPPRQQQQQQQRQQRLKVLKICQILNQNKNDFMKVIINSINITLTIFNTNIRSTTITCNNRMCQNYLFRVQVKNQNFSCPLSWIFIIKLQVSATINYLSEVQK